MRSPGASLARSGEAVTALGDGVASCWGPETEREQRDPYVVLVEPRPAGRFLGVWCPAYFIAAAFYEAPRGDLWLAGIAQSAPTRTAAVDAAVAEAESLRTTREKN